MLARVEKIALDETKRNEITQFTASRTPATLCILSSRHVSMQRRSISSLRNHTQVGRVERKWRRALTQVQELSCIERDTNQLPLFRKIVVSRRDQLKWIFND